MPPILLIPQKLAFLSSIVLLNHELDFLFLSVLSFSFRVRSVSLLPISVRGARFNGGWVVRPGQF